MEELVELIMPRLAASGAYDEESLSLAREFISDPGWRAALTIFSFPRIAKRVRPYLDFHGGVIEVFKLQKAAVVWSSGERALVDVALSLYNGEAKVDLMAVASNLSHAWMDTVIDGMLAYQGRTARSHLPLGA